MNIHIQISNIRCLIFKYLNIKTYSCYTETISFLSQSNFESGIKRNLTRNEICETQIETPFSFLQYHEKGACYKIWSGSHHWMHTILYNSCTSPPTSVSWQVGSEPLPPYCTDEILGLSLIGIFYPGPLNLSVMHVVWLLFTRYCATMCTVNDKMQSIHNSCGN